MDRKALERVVSKWPGVGSDIKWDADLVWSVAGKMFCALCLEGAEKGKLGFKVEAGRFLEFTDRPGFRPAAYLARAHWVTLDDPRVVPKDELAQLLRRSYDLVAAKLPKKTQRELGLL